MLTIKAKQSYSNVNDKSEAKLACVYALFRFFSFFSTWHRSRSSWWSCFCFVYPSPSMTQRCEVVSGEIFVNTSEKTLYAGAFLRFLSPACKVPNGSTRQSPPSNSTNSSSTIRLSVDSVATHIKFFGDRPIKIESP